MLVIRRRVGEAIVISGEIEVTVLEVSGSRVKLGVAARASVPVQRKEIVEAARQNQAAAQSAVQERLGDWARQWVAPGGLTRP